MRQLIVLGFVGLLAQLIDGSLGMAYGVTSTTLLLAAGTAPAAASAAVHFSELGTTLVSGISHHRFGNVDWRTVSILAGPGFIGALIGSTVLANLNGEAVTPWVSGILLALGVYVIWRFLALGGRRPTFRSRPSAGMLVPVGFVGGALDAIGGGGWGPIGTTSLLSSGRLEPRKVIGSVDTSEFLVAVGGSLGFLIALGSQGIEWTIVAALLIGGVVAAPFAAWLVKLLPARVLAIAAGGIIVLTNARTILLALGMQPTAVWLVLGALAVVWFALLVRVARLERRVSAARAAEDAASSVSVGR
ncbi:sulfite exporter TauE/SafE family protein [Brevibacterium renqingii]|uniref:sulfite exporter TauE/SafE family protein n=1 Tax=Brevibacterium renqingii TaxID=2776916 RepID=UPI001ADF31C5|nr:sulfite exporter TauE/SafE family protein [Brevibacterium renqingii]